METDTVLLRIARKDDELVVRATGSRVGGKIYLTGQFTLETSMSLSEFVKQSLVELDELLSLKPLRSERVREMG
jgi:hypothetical protein